MYWTKLKMLPELADTWAMDINLNDHARAHAGRQPAPRDPKAPSPFLDPRMTNDYLRTVHRANAVGYSFGGYLEDRADLWRGSYLNHDNAVHLGMDINVPAETAVSVKFASTVEGIIHDPDQDGGWGSVVLLSLDKPVGDISHYLYAHLGQNKIDVTAGQHLAARTPVGRVGHAQENGGWYDHLHVQAFTKQAWQQCQGNLANFDGYGTVSAEERNHPLFPHPMLLL